MGADEIFFGYRRQMATLLGLRYKHLPLPIRKMMTAIVEPLPVKISKYGLKQVRWAKRFLSFANMTPSDSYMRSYTYYDTDQLDSLFLDINHSHLTQMYDEHKDLFNKRYHDPVNQMCHTDIHMFMNGLNLTYSDRASMAASVEVRVPFIDKEIITFAMNLNGKIEISSKYIKIYPEKSC